MAEKSFLFSMSAASSAAQLSPFFSRSAFAISSSSVIDEFERVARKNNMSLYREKKRAELKGRRILMAEDVFINAEIMKQIITTRGAEIDHAENGRLALGMFGNSAPDYYDAILMDVRMPEMDGIEATERIKAKYGSEITVVILTAYNWDYIAEDAKRVGVDSFLAKPLFASNVIDEFERIARRNHMSLYKEKKRAELKGRRILIAEDVFVNVAIMKKLIQVREAEIDHAENGRLVVEMFQNSPVGYYDAILMDVRMPEMDGLEATAAIRALDRPDAKTVPIIALTANAFDEDVQLSLQAGMNAHLSKPVEPEHLYQTLEELIWEKENR